jgi:hypothetical protein
MLPRLNQNLKKYQSKTVNEYGDATYSNPVEFMGRLVEGQETDYSSRGKEASYDASLHLNPTPEMQEGDVIGYPQTDGSEIYYSVINVTRTRGLDGNVLFQWCELAIEAGISVS